MNVGDDMYRIAMHAHVMQSSMQVEKVQPAKSCHTAWSSVTNPAGKCMESRRVKGRELMTQTMISTSRKHDGMLESARQESARQESARQESARQESARKTVDELHSRLWLA